MTYIFCLRCVWADEDEGDGEKAGPSQTELCCGDGLANSLSDASNEPQPVSNHTQPPHDHADSNGSQNLTEPAGGADTNCTDRVKALDTSAAADTSTGPAAEQTQAAEEHEEEKQQQQEEDEEAAACSPSTPAKRRACRKTRKSLFTIQAVNSNGTTERSMGEGGSAVSFSCKLVSSLEYAFIVKGPGVNMEGEK